MIDEGPSLDDLNRFGSDEAFCPECGAEIYDQAEFCPHCKSPIGGNTLRRHPEAHAFQKRWIMLIAIIVLLAFLLMVRIL